MVKDEVLEQLFARRAELTHLIVELSPQGDAERERITRLVLDRDRMNEAIHDLIDTVFKKPSSPELSTAVAALNDASKKLKDLKKTLDTVDQVIDVTGKVIDITIKIVALAAAA